MYDYVIVFETEKEENIICLQDIIQEECTVFLSECLTENLLMERIYYACGFSFSPTQMERFIIFSSEFCQKFHPSQNLSSQTGKGGRGI
jgi:hypothetical protein